MTEKSIPYPRKSDSYWRSIEPSDDTSMSARSSAFSGSHATLTGRRPINSASKPYFMKSEVFANRRKSDGSSEPPVSAAESANPITPRFMRLAMSSPSVSNAPLTINKMWRVLMVRLGFLPDLALIAICICPIMSCGLTTLTLDSSMSLRRFIWTPLPETSLPPARPSRLAILSISSMYTMPYWATSTSPSAAFTRSRTRSSTSLPTYPVSENFVASALTKGTPMSLAIVRMR